MSEPMTFLPRQARRHDVVPTGLLVGGPPSVVLGYKALNRRGGVVEVLEKMLSRLLSPWLWALCSFFLLVTQSTTLAVDPPRKSNGLTDVVQWDNYTLFLHEQRMFL